MAKPSSKAEVQQISLIADRYIESCKKGNLTIPEKISLVMTIDIAHQSCPLDLEALLKAPVFNFLHDLFIIVGYTNHETKEIEGNILPSFAIER